MDLWIPLRQFGPFGDDTNAVWINSENTPGGGGSLAIESGRLPEKHLIYFFSNDDDYQRLGE